MKGLGVPTKLFNVGDYRRHLVGTHVSHAFFDYTNQDTLKKRHKAAQDALEELISWLRKGSATVAVYDATNTTRERRQLIFNRLKEFERELGVAVQVLFVESVCEDEELVMENIRSVKINSPDYQGWDPAKASYDFRQRIQHYEEVYEAMDEADMAYVKLMNVGQRVVLNRIQGYLESRLVFYLMNLHIEKRAIFFSRHGESVFNVEGKIGGDADLSEHGRQYARALPVLINTHLPNANKLNVWTSTLRRTIQTAEHLPYPKLSWKALDELNAGLCDGLTYEEIAEAYPEDYANRDHDKYNYRYRGGESYGDVVLRLEPVIMELERQHDILIIGHQAVLRCVYAYFMNKSREELPYLKIPLHTLIKLTPRAYGCDEERFKANISAVDTHRPKPLGA